MIGLLNYWFLRWIGLRIIKVYAEYPGTMLWWTVIRAGRHEGYSKPWASQGKLNKLLGEP